MTPDILTLGEALIEFMRQPDDGNRVLYEQGFGGDTSNTAIAAARQGASVGYLSAVGDDLFGQALRDLWRREAVSDAHVLTRPGDPTGAYFVQPHASGRHFSYARRGSAASLYGPTDLPETTIAQAKVLHSSGLSQAISPTMRAAVRRAAEIARAGGTLVSFDINLRLNLWSLEEAKAAAADILPLADIVFPSDDEAEKLTSLTDPDAILDHYLAFGARIVALKRGARGVMIATPEARHSIPPDAATPVDSTGAGDSFAGAFLAYYIESGDVVQAGQLAAKVAAGTVSGLGAIAPIPRRDQVRPG
ncbi:sugar kinase [Rhodobacteraceae bacterium W635]|uniref:sugar kinase n=1 Tax=Nioella halotolerans TaxID=2303578 RepID=UPI000E3C6056|nr:sugar kinase [Rhodobacteraceae bacterium W635]